jgi:endonuclease/exonuclease/phosphatase (EEP) superfamily protein YafD
MLQELSGVVTPFDAVARREQEDAALQHTIDIEKLAKEYETKMGALREQYHAQAVASVTTGLMNMAAQARKPEETSG